MSDLDLNTRAQIILAAKERFLHYGYPKTTMAEVAADCNMSPGNLYRYFKGKLDIAIEIGNHFPLLSATWSAHAFKIIHFLKTNKIREAKLKLEKFYSAAKEIKGDAIVDRLIINLCMWFSKIYYLTTHFFKNHCDRTSTQLSNLATIND